MKLQGNNYQERALNQLDEWVEGNSIHNHVDDECCPDFSCCIPSIKAKQETRALFKSLNNIGDRDNLAQMLSGFLVAMLKKKFGCEVQAIYVGPPKQNLN